eukprot:526474_1
MGCGNSKDPLLADIYSSYEQKYDFEQIFPSDPSQPSEESSNNNNSFYGITFNTNISGNSNSPLLQDKINDSINTITDEDIDINNNSSNLSEQSNAYDILIDLNNKISKLIIRFTRYNGNELEPIIKLGLNESKHSPDRTNNINDNNNIDAIDYVMGNTNNNRGLFRIELIISYFIRNSNVNVFELCPQKFFPNDIKAMIISFYSYEHPKIATFRILVSTAILCRSIVNFCNYIGCMLSKKLLFQNVITINKNNEINQQIIISSANASICRQLIFLFHYILCLDQYKMPKQQPLTNNFTAYKRMHSQFKNKQNYSGGGFASFKNNSNKSQFTHNLTNNELFNGEDVTNTAMFMGKGSTACIDTICESMESDNEIRDICILSEFANGCLTLLRANGNNKNRNLNIVKYALYILRAIVAILLILDNKKSKENQFNSIFGNNENKVRTVQCCKMITKEFLQYYGDDVSIQNMQAINNKNDIIYHIKYCKRFTKFGAKGFKNDQVKRSIENMFEQNAEMTLGTQEKQ